MRIGSDRDLRARLRSIYKGEPNQLPLAILCGSGLTNQVIAGAKRIVETVRKGLDEQDRADFDETISAYQDVGEMYQAAFEFLAYRESPAYRDRVIRLTTLGAYQKQIGNSSDLDPQRVVEYEEDVDGWKLPAGVAALGRIWSGTDSRLRGPILTSNFDPLCEIAIRKAGSAAITNVIDADGSFLRDVRISSEPHVVHFHGFWRESATLSMVSQLTQQRPALSSSLQGVLQRHTLLVIGYGGWRDALTTQILRVIEENQATALDILWCFHGSLDELETQIASNDVLNRLARAPGNVKFYAGIDANKILPLVEQDVADRLDYSSNDRTEKARAGLIGWEAVTASTKENRTSEAQTSAALSFFDGRLPTWADTRSEYIPRRDVSQTSSNLVRSSIISKESSLTLLIGPSGEGKTTALMQAAQDLADTVSSPTSILFHPDGGLPSVGDVLSLPSNRTNILVIDDGARCVDRLRELTAKINEGGRTDFHILIAARTADWQNAGGSTFAWSRHLRVYQHRVAGMNRADALSVVTAWERIGETALGQLASLPTQEARVQRLLQASTDGDRSEGAFLGALLTTRHGENFDQHVTEMMQRLDEWKIVGSAEGLTLLDAFVTISLPHSLGIRSLTPELLSRALGISRDDLSHSILHPLGEEAAVSFTATNVLVRHTRIAEVALAKSALAGADLQAAAERLVQAAVKEIDRDGFHSDLSDFAYLSRRLSNPELAVAAAKAAVSAAPLRLSYKTSLSRALRGANKASDACLIAEAAYIELRQSTDQDTGARPFLNEWGVAEGHANRYMRNFLLCATSASDNPDLRTLRVDHARAILSCLSVAGRKLAERSEVRTIFTDAVLAIACLTSTSRTVSGESWQQELEGWLTSNGVDRTLSDRESIGAILHATRTAHLLAETPFAAPHLNGNIRLDSFLRVCQN